VRQGQATARCRRRVQGSAPWPRRWCRCLTGGGTRRCRERAAHLDGQRVQRDARHTRDVRLDCVQLRRRIGSRGPAVAPKRLSLQRSTSVVSLRAGAATLRAPWTGRSAQTGCGREALARPSLWFVGDVYRHRLRTLIGRGGGVRVSSCTGRRRGRRPSGDAILRNAASIGVQELRHVLVCRCSTARTACKKVRDTWPESPPPLLHARRSRDVIARTFHKLASQSRVVGLCARLAVSRQTQRQRRLARMRLGCA